MDIVCSNCGAEPGDADETPESLALGGWDLDGEYGASCPECVGCSQATGESNGLEAVIEALEEGKGE